MAPGIAVGGTAVSITPTPWLDGTMGAAVIVVSDGKFYDPTISRVVNFMARAKTGPITGKAKVTQLGKSIAFVEGRLTADDGTLLATASTSTRLVEAAKAIG
jgi:acyl-coenzyme A thioesterase PaaI-like protein